MPKGMKFIYNCTKCGTRPGGPDSSDMEARDMLTVKRVSFCHIGEGNKHKKSKVVDWLCRDCLLEDPAWIGDAWKPPMRPLTLEEEIDLHG